MVMGHVLLLSLLLYLPGFLQFFSSGVLDTSQCPRMIWFKVYLSEFFYESMTSLRKRVSIKLHITARSAGFPIALKHIICFKGLFVNTRYSVKPHFNLKFTNVRVTYKQEKKIQCIYGSCKGKQTANQ